MNNRFDEYLLQMPVVAILRGVQPEEVVDIANAIYAAGIRIIEVPLNSPQATQSIQNLATQLGDECVVGCGTLLRNEQVESVAVAGARIAVMPHTDAALIRRCFEFGLTPIPGFATPSEALVAVDAGARYLKLFPAASFGPSHLAATRAILPVDPKILAVGGVGAADAADWLAAGADGLGIGGELYKPGRTAKEVGERAKQIVATIKAAR